MRRWRPLFVAWSMLAWFALGSTAWATNVSGTISTNTTWTTGGSPYVMTGNVTVASGVTLTINAGVTVQGNASTRVLTVNGALAANGSSGSPIVFTSTTDTAAGQWTGISFGTSATASNLTWVNVRYGGGSAVSDANAMVAVNGGTVTIEDSTFSNSADSGIGVFGGTTGSAAALVVRRTKSETNGFVGAAQHGSGMFVNNANVTVEDSAFWANATDGVRFSITSAYAAAASQLSGTSFWANTRWGVNIGNSTGTSLSLAPDGNVSGKPANDVYDNGTFGFSTSESWSQLTITQATQSADWTGTYWGTGDVPVVRARYRGRASQLRRAGPEPVHQPAGRSWPGHALARYRWWSVVRER